MCYLYIDISIKWLDFRVFSDKDVKIAGTSDSLSIVCNCSIAFSLFLATSLPFIDYRVQFIFLATSLPFVLHLQFIFLDTTMPFNRRL